MHDGLMTNDWDRLAEYVVTRRAELGITQIQVAQRGQMSLDRVQSIEAVRRQGGYRANTLAALERALQWEYGSIKAILAGHDPTPIESTQEVQNPFADVPDLEEAIMRQPDLSEEGKKTILSVLRAYRNTP